MLELIFYGVLGLFSFILLILAYKKNWSSVVGAFSGAFLMFCFIRLLVLFLYKPTKDDISKKLIEYDKLKEKVEVINNTKNQETKVFIPELIYEVDKMNSVIDENKLHCNSKWDGYYYSHELAELEKLKIKL